MESYKICPACAQKNSAVEAMCPGCGTELYGVAVKTSPDKSEEAPAEACERKLKKCSNCGAETPDYLMICERCGEIVSDVSISFENKRNQSGGAGPSARKEFVKSEDSCIRPEISPNVSPALYSKSDNISIPLMHGYIFGRCDKCNPPRMNHGRCLLENESRDYVDCVKYDTVSRKHARFAFENGSLFITVLPEAKNATFLNGIEIKRGEKHAVKNGDRIKFSSKLELAVRI